MANSLQWGPAIPRMASKPAIHIRLVILQAVLTAEFNCGLALLWPSELRKSNASRYSLQVGRIQSRATTERTSVAFLATAQVAATQEWRIGSAISGSLGSMLQVQCSSPASSAAQDHTPGGPAFRTSILAMLHMGRPLPAAVSLRSHPSNRTSERPAMIKNRTGRGRPSPKRKSTRPLQVLLRPGTEHVLPYRKASPPTPGLLHSLLLQRTPLPIPSVHLCSPDPAWRFFISHPPARVLKHHAALEREIRHCDGSPNGGNASIRDVVRCPMVELLTSLAKWTVSRLRLRVSKPSPTTVRSPRVSLCQRPHRPASSPVPYPPHPQAPPFLGLTRSMLPRERGMACPARGEPGELAHFKPQPTFFPATLLWVGMSHL